MICGNCDGTGNIGNGMWICCECDGTGEIQTNEEWFDRLSTKEKARVIHIMTTACYACGADGVDYKRCPFRKNCAGPKEIEDWLKERHDEYGRFT